MKRPRDTDNSQDGPSDEGAPPPRRRDPNAGATRRDSGAGRAFGGVSGRGSSRGSSRGVGEGFAGKSGGNRGGGGGSRRSSLRASSGPLASSEPTSDRPRQIAGEIRRAVQTELARGLNDPRVQGMVSITVVEVTPDLAEARIKVSVLPEERASLTLSGLRAAAGFLRRRVMDETRIGRVPRLLFDLDAGLKRESALEATIRAARAGDSAEAVEPSHGDQDDARDEGDEKRDDESERKTT